MRKKHHYHPAKKKTNEYNHKSKSYEQAFLTIASIKVNNKCRLLFFLVVWKYFDYFRHLEKILAGFPYPLPEGLNHFLPYSLEEFELKERING